jgi:uncharacterized membrane protein (UPF0127 family)
MAVFRKSIFCLVLLSALSRAQMTRLDAPQKLKSSEFTVCGQKLKLEVADNTESRTTGLMFRKSLGKGKGMLFVFSEPEKLSFWMKNVPFDIDIAFFSEKGKFLNALTMMGTSPVSKDDSLPRYASRGKALYAVEVEKGFFKSISTKKCVLEPLSQNVNKL